MRAFVLIAVLLPACAVDADPRLQCGDDIYDQRGLDVELAGADTSQTYEIDVVADGTPFELTYAGGATDSVEIDTNDGTRLSGIVREGWTEPLVSALSIVLREPGYLNGWGPETATVNVTMQGESIAETFTPIYEGNTRWPQCRLEYALVTMNVPTP